MGIDILTLYFKDIEININNPIKKEDFNIILFDTEGEFAIVPYQKVLFSKKRYIILFYDITNRISFEDIKSLLEDIIEKKILFEDWKNFYHL